MRFDIFSLFPEIFPSYLNTSILKKAQDVGHLKVHTHNIRDYATDKHHTTDDTPYGGGPGMVMKCEPIAAALESLRGKNSLERGELAQYDHLALLCGRYESLDERIRQHLVTDSISIGDYVLTGGELPALIIIDAVTRLLPGVLGDPQAAIDDSHATGILEYPHYTRPPEYRGWDIPDVLLSGNHAEIDRWRRHEALRRTLEQRPDLLITADLSQEDLAFLESLGYRPQQPG